MFIVYHMSDIGLGDGYLIYNPMEATVRRQAIKTSAYNIVL